MAKITSPDTVASQVHKAREVLLVSPELSVADRRVAGALLAHLNLKSGRCDPGQGRIATMLNMDRSTVERAVARLQKVGLFVVARHGGGAHRNAYVPNWPEFKRRHAAWESLARGPTPRTAAGTTPRTAAGTTPRTAAGTTPRTAAGTTPRTAAGETLRSKLSEETLSASTREAVRSTTLVAASSQRAFEHSERAEFGQDIATGNWWRDLYAKHGGTRELEPMTMLAMDMASQLDAAEMQQPGAGLCLLEATWRQRKDDL